MSDQLDAVTLAVAGDLRGHIVGTVSRQSGTVAVTDAEVKLTGATPLGTWTHVTKSGDNGFFQSDLPFGTVDNIDITVTEKGNQTQVRVNSADIAKGLTPRPNPGSTDLLTLEGEWRFAPDPNTDFLAALERIDWHPIQVPSHWEMAGFVSEHGVGLYSKTLTIPAGWHGKRVKFRSEGIYSRAQIWLNGEYVGGHDGGATPFELDITHALKPDQANVLAILVYARSDASDLDAMSYYAHITMAGLWRPLALFCVEPAHISRLALVTEFDAAYQDATLTVELAIANEQPNAIEEANLKLRLFDPEGKEIALDSLSTQLALEPWAQQSVCLRAAVKTPAQWNAEQPQLYKLRAELAVPNQETSSIEQSFGFRQVEIKGRAYQINGRSVKFWGSCRHDAHPLRGRSITREIARQDIELMKGANLNAFRTAHYPPHPAVLEFADQYGLYVEDEAPFCFVSVSYGPELGRAHNLAEDLRLAPLTISLTSELLERDRNHPAVVIWSLCNESKWGTIFAMAREFVKGADPTRPLSAGQSANLDIATYHCPTSLYRIQEQTIDFQTPVLFDEGFPIFQGVGPQAQALELDPGLRDFWVTAHFEAVKALLRSEHQFGSMIWAWVDDTFLTPGKGIEYGRRNLPRTHFIDNVYKLTGRGIVGDPPFGIVEGWRRPRPEWWLCKKLFAPIQIAEQSLDLPKPGEPIRVNVENRHVFTNLNQYRCQWQLAGEQGEVRVAVAPLGQGVIEIVPRHQPVAEDTLVLEFLTEQGQLINGARLPFQAYAPPHIQCSDQAVQVVEEPTVLTFASIIRLVGSNVELAFDRTSGSIIRGLAGRQQVIMGGPTLHMQKIHAPLDPYPDDWHFTGAEYHTEQNEAVLNWNGYYGDQLRGGFVVRMDAAGNVTIAYTFTQHGPAAIVHEIGLALEVPLECNKLAWARKAEWSYYPDDHIGRSHGVAVAHPDTPQTVPPGDRSFGLDDHPWGSNDFRSAKRNIDWASLVDPQGAGIKVLSNGTQHVRATICTHSISLKVLAYYGGVVTGTGEWDTGGYGNGQPVKTGDVIEGVVRLQLLLGKL